MTENLYDILSVSLTASHSEIRKAYRKLAVQYHPDRNPDEAAQDVFRKITQAYEVLNDPTRRDLYDRYGDIAPKPNFKGFDQDTQSHSRDFSSFFNGTQPYQGSDGFDSSSSSRAEENDTRQGWQQDEPYETFSFGTGSRARTRRASDAGYDPLKKGTDITVELKIGFIESLRGCSEKVKIARQSRWKRGSNAGVHQELVAISVPANTESGTEVVLRGKGNYGQGGGDAGNLVATIVVQSHPYLTKLGVDLYLTVPLTLKEALLGAKVEVPTLTGSLRIQIPPGAHIGQKLRLKNRGLPNTKGGQGDLYLLLRPEFPEGTTEQLLDIAEQLERLYPPEGVRGTFHLDD